MSICEHSDVLWAFALRNLVMHTWWVVWSITHARCVFLWLSEAAWSLTLPGITLWIEIHFMIINHHHFAAWNYILNSILFLLNLIVFRFHHRTVFAWNTIWANFGEFGLVSKRRIDQILLTKSFHFDLINLLYELTILCCKISKVIRRVLNILYLKHWAVWINWIWVLRFIWLSTWPLEALLLLLFLSASSFLFLIDLSRFTYFSAGRLARQRWKRLCVIA